MCAWVALARGVAAGFISFEDLTSAAGVHCFVIEAATVATHPVMSTESTVESVEAATAVDQSGVDGEGMAAAEGTMRAAIIEQYGAADEFKIRDVPIPALGARQVLVRVHAASVNPVDWKIRNGTLPVGIGRFPLVLGRDCAGVVEKGA